jgi:ADP-heptose:LPS heptosyltransferase
VLSALIGRFPTARISVACGPLAAPLFEPIREVARVIVMVKQPRHGHWRILWRETIGTAWDLVVDLRNTLISRLLRRRALRVFRGPKPGQHMVEALSELLDIAPPAGPRLWLDGPTLERAAAEIPGDRPVLALAPAANWPGKTWRPERFAALARALTAEGAALAGARVVLLGAAGERGQSEPVKAALPPSQCIDLVGRGDTLNAGAYLSQTDLFIGNDSGLMHLAAAVGIPTLGLFGPSLPERYRPWGPNGGAVRTALTYDELVGVPGYDHRTTGTLMDSLEVDTVVAAAEALYRKIRSRPG